MANPSVSKEVYSTQKGNVAIIYAGDYLNKQSGERVEYECNRHLSTGYKSLVISFRETKIVNSIGVSILIGIIESAKKTDSTLVFSEANRQTISLFNMLGLTKHVLIAESENEALDVVTNRLSEKK